MGKTVNQFFFMVKGMLYWFHCVLFTFFFSFLCLRVNLENVSYLTGKKKDTWCKCERISYHFQPHEDNDLHSLSDGDYVR